MRIVTFVAGILVGAFGGAATVYILTDKNVTTGSERWLTVPELRPVGPDSNLSYTTEAMGSEIPLPGVKWLTAKVKLMPSLAEGSDLALGYVITVDVADLDITKLPEKYRKEKREKIGGRDFTRLPLEQVAYEVRPWFSIVDKDGFRLLTVSGQSHTLFSGKSNELQGMSSDSVSHSLSARIAKVIPSLLIGRCISCE